MAIVSGSTKGPSRPRRRAPQILAPVGVEDAPAVLPRESNRLTTLVDKLAVDVVLRHATGRRVLDLGRGAPKVTEWVAARAERLTVVDAVDLGRGPSVVVPLPAEAFDCVFSLRTLPHLGHDAETSQAALQSTLGEIGRLLVPGGVAVLQFDNARSPVGLLHGLRQLASDLGRGPLVIDSARGVTRFDVLGRLTEGLPPTLAPMDLHGLRLWVATPHLLAIPLLGRVLTRLEWYGRDQPLLRRLAAHLLLVLRRPNTAQLTPPGPTQ